MVDTWGKTRRKPSPRDIEEIRFLRFCGLSMVVIGARMEFTEDAVRWQVSKHKLDRPVSEFEAVRMELLASYRGTIRRLEAADLSAADHARLCVTQVRQATVLMRPLATELKNEEAEMSRKTDAARQRILNLTDEEALDELRRLAGLEGKAIGDLGKGGASPLDGQSLSDEPIPGPGHGGAEAAGEE